MKCLLLVITLLTPVSWADTAQKGALAKKKSIDLISNIFPHGKTVYMEGLATVYSKNSMEDVYIAVVGNSKDKFIRIDVKRVAGSLSVISYKDNISFKGNGNVMANVSVGKNTINELFKSFVELMLGVRRGTSYFMSDKFVWRHEIKNQKHLVDISPSDSSVNVKGFELYLNAKKSFEGLKFFTKTLTLGVEWHTPRVKSVLKSYRGYSNINKPISMKKMLKDDVIFEHIPDSAYEAK